MQMIENKQKRPMLIATLSAVFGGCAMHELQLDPDLPLPLPIFARRASYTRTLRMLLNDVAAIRNARNSQKTNNGHQF
jgi:hypothetical protein